MTEARDARDGSDAMDAKETAALLAKATAMTDEEVFKDAAMPKYTTIDYYRMACHRLFQCKRCGTCCATGDPIRLKYEDISKIAKHLKIPPNKAIKKLTVPDPERKGVLDFKHILPCKFYDTNANVCKIYVVRPWSCRIFPFLGIYGSENQVKVNESCPGSVATMKMLTAAMEEIRSLMPAPKFSVDEIRQAKLQLRAALDNV